MLTSPLQLKTKLAVSGIVLKQFYTRDRERDASMKP
jgi:hypothetical protein